MGTELAVDLSVRATGPGGEHRLGAHVRPLASDVTPLSVRVHICKMG